MGGTPRRRNRPQDMGMTRQTKLTTQFVKAIKKPGRYSDGPGSFGLSLLVRPIRSGLSKTWQQRFKIDGRQRSIGLGPIGTLSLYQARALAAEHALTHIEGSATIRAYKRSDLFEKRRELMNAWADYLDE